MNCLIIGLQKISLLFTLCACVLGFSLPHVLTSNISFVSRTFELPPQTIVPDIHPKKTANTLLLCHMCGNTEFPLKIASVTGNVNTQR